MKPAVCVKVDHDSHTTAHNTFLICLAAVQLFTVLYCQVSQNMFQEVVDPHEPCLWSNGTQNSHTSQPLPENWDTL